MQILLGHAKADVTQIYAERDMGLACQGLWRRWGKGISRGPVVKRITRGHVLKPVDAAKLQGWLEGAGGRVSYAAVVPVKTTAESAAVSFPRPRHSFPSSRSSTQHPRTCGPSDRQCARMSALSQPAS